MLTFRPCAVWDGLTAWDGLLAVLSQHIVCILPDWRCACLSAPDDLHQAIALHRAAMSRQQAYSLQADMTPSQACPKG